MTKLSRAFQDTLQSVGVKAFKIDRATAKLWSRQRGARDVRVFVGWYWNQVRQGRVVQADEDGPFTSRSAALTDAYKKLGLVRRSNVTMFNARPVLRRA